MPQNSGAPFGDYIAFVDESGDHGMSNIDSGYPIFVLALCLFKKTDYTTTICPSLQKLKFDYWGHDQQVLHEHEIRKPNNHYIFLFDKVLRSRFLEDTSRLIKASSFKVVTSVIDKAELSKTYAAPPNPYELSLEFCLERLYLELNALGQRNVQTHVIVEQRGKKEDNEIELAFRRICGGENALRKTLPFHLVMAPKSSNCAGLQIADLIARPIGLSVLRPNQPNQAYNIICQKFRRDPHGEIKGWGLKIFP